MQVFEVTLQQMMVFFVIMVVGFFLNKKRLIPTGMDDVLSKLLFYILAPSLSFQTFAQNLKVETVIEKMTFLVWGTVLVTVLACLSYFIAKLFTKEKFLRNVFIYSLTVANIGYMGYPLLEAVFGAEALLNGMIFGIPFNVYIYSIGLALLNPTIEKISLRSLVNPTFCSIFLGTIFGLFEIPVPVAFDKAISVFAAFVGPCAMLLAGYVIGKFQIKSLFKDWRLYVITAMRLLIIPICVGAILSVFDVSMDVMIVVLCNLAMPLGLNTVVFPAVWGGDTKPGASMALISSIFAVGTIPFVLWLFV